MWFQENLFKGIVVYISIYIALVILMLPATIMTLAGAFTFSQILGPIKGFFIALLIVMISATIGGLCAFVVGRYLLKKCITKFLISKVRVLRAIYMGLS